MKKRVNLARRVATAVAIVVPITVALAGPALAEGTINTSMSGFWLGDESRVWADRNADATNGYVSFAKCNRKYVTIGVFRAAFGPDTNVARGTAYCSSTATGSVSFGDVAAGDYHFTVEGMGAGWVGIPNGFSANPVVIRY